MLPSDPSQVIEQGKFSYSALGKASKKQIKRIEDPWSRLYKIQNLQNNKNQNQMKAYLQKINKIIKLNKI